MISNGKNTPLFVIAIALTLGTFSFSALKDFQQAVTNLSHCKFKLHSVSDFTLAGVSLAGKSSIGLADGAKLVYAFAKEEFPASFTLNVAAVNPNDGTEGKTKASATLTSFAWKLSIDNKETVSGDIPSAVVIPGTGQESIIPLRVNLDLVRFFKEKGYEHVVNLALALGGANGSPGRLTLKAKPTINTDVGPITYPDEITIVDKEFH